MAGTITRGKVIRADLAQWDGATATHSRIDATGGTVTGLAIGNEVDVLQVYGSGTSRTRGTIADAVQRIGSSRKVTLSLAPGTWTIDANLTIPSNFALYVPRGCLLTTSTGVTLTINGPVFAGDYQIFDLTVGSVAGLVESSALWFGIAADNSTDNSTVMAAICAVSGHRIYWPSGTIKTSDFTPPSNSEWHLKNGLVFKDTGALGASERLMNITTDNVVIFGYGAKVQMTRADYVTGEQRHGVNIRDAENVWIYGLESSDCGGDGFYIGGDSGPSINVHLIDCKADNNRRQGLSIVAARHVRVVDFRGTNTTGTAPSAGIDIEPNASTDVLEDIKIIRPRLTGNDGPGIEIFLAGWNATSNYADIEIIEPYTNDNGNVSVGGRVRPGIDINRIGSTTPCRGRIKIVEPMCVDENYAGIHVYDWDVNGPLVEIIRPTIINPNQAQASTSTTSGGIILHNSTSHTSAPGNVRITEPLIRDDDGFLNAASLGVIRISGAWTQVEITNPKYGFSGTNPWVVDATARPRIHSDPEIAAALTGNTTISDGRYLGRLITNTGASGGINITLIQATSDRVGWRLSVEVHVAQTMNLVPNGADQIMPLASGYAAGTSVKSAVIGSRLTLECRQAGYWHIVGFSGVWAIDPGSGTPTTYAASNVTTDRTYDANATTTDELADVLGTLINDLRERGFVR